MSNFFEAVARVSRWRISIGDRRGLPPRAYINPKDFQNGKAPGTAYAMPEFPKFAPPDWQKGIVEYVSEEECERIFSEHYHSVMTAAWEDFSFNYGKALARAKAERKIQRRIRRNKRAYNYWSGYAMGLKAALGLAEQFFRPGKRQSGG